MTQTFRLKKGQISFAEDRIVISDDAKKQKSITLLSTGVTSIWGIVNIGKFEQSGDEFFHSFWIVLVILSLLIFFVTFLRSTNRSNCSIIQTIGYGVFIISVETSCH